MVGVETGFDISRTPPDRNRFRHPPYLQGNYFPRLCLGTTFSRDTLLRFGANQCARAFSWLLILSTMSKQSDIIDQARLSAYFADMQEEFFEDKLKRLVSLFSKIPKNCYYRSLRHVLFLTRYACFLGLQVRPFDIQ